MYIWAKEHRLAGFLNPREVKEDLEVKGRKLYL